MNAALPTSFSFSFTGFAKRGGCSDKHCDGWGIAFYEGRGLRTFLDPGPAAQSPIATLVAGYPVKTHNMMAHIRYATIGNGGALENVHPFTRELVSSEDEEEKLNFLLLCNRYKTHSALMG